MGKKGQKQGGSHSTVIDAAEKFVREANRIPGLKRYALGFIDTSARAKTPRMKLTPQQGYVLATVIGARSSQEVRFYGEPRYLERELTALWNRLH